MRVVRASLYDEVRDVNARASIARSLDPNARPSSRDDDDDDDIARGRDGTEWTTMTTITMADEAGPVPTGARDRGARAVRRGRGDDGDRGGCLARSSPRRGRAGVDAGAGIDAWKRIRRLTRGTLGLDVDSRAQVDADSNKHTTRHHVHRERDADRVLQS